MLLLLKSPPLIFPCERVSNLVNVVSECIFPSAKVNTVAQLKKLTRIKLTIYHSLTVQENKLRHCWSVVCHMKKIKRLDKQIKG